MAEQFSSFESALAHLKGLQSTLREKEVALIKEEQRNKVLEKELKDALEVKVKVKQEIEAVKREVKLTEERHSNNLKAAENAKKADQLLREVILPQKRSELRKWQEKLDYLKNEGQNKANEKNKNIEEAIKVNMCTARTFGEGVNSNL